MQSPHATSFNKTFRVVKQVLLCTLLSPLLSNSCSKDDEPAQDNLVQISITNETDDTISLIATNRTHPALLNPNPFTDTLPFRFSNRKITAYPGDNVEIAGIIVPKESNYAYFQGTLPTTDTSFTVPNLPNTNIELIVHPNEYWGLEVSSSISEEITEGLKIMYEMDGQVLTENLTTFHLPPGKPEAGGALKYWFIDETETWSNLYIYYVKPGFVYPNGIRKFLVWNTPPQPLALPGSNLYRVSVTD